jgi:hypothetical protein
VIVAAVVCPHPPLLLRELSGAEDAVPELRAACHDALASALAVRPDAVVVVGGADAGGEWAPSLPVEVHPFGTPDAPHVTGLPLSLGVASRLLDEAGWTGPLHLHTVPWDAGPGAVADVAGKVRAVEGRVVLLVMGDGSARRGAKAPGYLDERAFAFDDGVGRALEQGDAGALAGLDRGLAEELMVLGRAAFAVLGEVAAAQDGTPRCQVPYRDDPYGVMYTVALWSLEQPAGRAGRTG